MKWTQVLGVSVLLAIWMGAGCSSKKSDPEPGGAAGAANSGGTDGSGASGPGPVVECGPSGTSCEKGEDCCSGLCGGSVCVRSATECSPGGYSCSSNLDCCTANCVDEVCRESSCIEDNQPCSAGGEACCGGECVDGACADINGDQTCKVSGNSCEDDGECCSKLCQDGKCYARSSYCTQSGDTCSEGTDCCEGICDKTHGTSYGFCARPSTDGSSGCNANELLAGEVCNGDCSKCCSRSCAPNHLGVFVCQLSGGCRPAGEICTQDADCCGGRVVEDLPGSQANHPTTCEKRNPDDVFGQCSRAGGCTPRGDTCQINLNQEGGGSSCGDSSTSKPSNCCPVPEGQCALDALFVPRCGAGGECRAEGETCASSADCCDLRPCVPDAEGAYRCGAECIEASGSCTVNADCCAGTLCVIPPGEVTGTCGGADDPPGGTGGGSGTGGDSGTGGNGSGECVAYGQQCGEASDCCHSETGIVCAGGRCVIIR